MKASYVCHAARVAFALVAGAVVVPLAALAQSGGSAYPARAVRLVVAYAAGGSNDIVARALAQRLTDAWGQAVVIDNKPGGGTVIGTDAVAKAAPDGYTLLITPPAITINPGLIRKLPYDALRDFAPVTLININPQVLIVHPGVPVTTVRALIALAKARPGGLNYSSSGSGGANHLAGELFNSMAGVKIVHIPYKGNAPSLIALAGGEVDLAFNSLPSALPLLRAGKLRALGVTSKTRSGAVPELPTLDEAGLRGYEAVAWTGLCAPAGTPPDTVGRINAAVVKIVQSADFKERLKAEGSDPVGSSIEQYAVFLRDEIVKWTKVIQSAGVKAD